MIRGVLRLVVGGALVGCKSDTGLDDDTPPPDTDDTDVPCTPPTQTTPVLVTDATWYAPHGLLPDEACGPWTVIDTSDPEDPILMPDELDLGNDTDGELLGYRQTAEVLDLPEVVLFEVTMHSVINEEATGVQQAILSVQLGETDQQAVFVIAPDMVFLRLSDTLRGPTSFGATTTKKTYRLAVDTVTHVVEVYRNTSLVLTGTTYPAEGDVDDEIAWGELSTGAAGTTHWSWVAHNALRPTWCAEPDPCAR